MADRDRELRAALGAEVARLGADLTPLERVEDIPRLEGFVDDVALALITDARAAGASWADIADRLGVSRQAVHKRFSRRKPRRSAGIIELRFERRKR